MLIRGFKIMVARERSIGEFTLVRKCFGFKVIFVIFVRELRGIIFFELKEEENWVGGYEGFYYIV